MISIIVRLFVLSFCFFLVPKQLSAQERVVSCEVMGGLGNQLFQVATTLACAWDNGYVPIFPKLSSSPSFLEPRPVYWDTIFAKLSTAPQYTFNHYRRIAEKQERVFTPIELRDAHVQLVGYWQTERYFSSYKEKILSLFTLPEKENGYVNQRFAELTQDREGDVISLHLRLGDYLKIPGFMCLWKEEFKHYYKKAVACFPKDSLFMVFSDDIAYAQEFCRENFPFHQFVFPQEADFIELYLMARCNHNIIANSTFSWWGAYLNAHPEKIVISPKEWTTEGFQGVYYLDYLPKEWKTISVFDPLDLENQ